MKRLLTLLILSLLILCTLQSQTTSTVGNDTCFTKEQTREIYKIIIEHQYLTKDNILLGKEVDVLKSEVNLHEDRYLATRKQLKRQRFWKNTFILTTSVFATLFIIK